MSRPLPELSNEEVKRYSRHLIMPEVGVDGQRRLKAGSVLCIGAGGLGSPAALYLAWRHHGDFAAGILANALCGGDNCHRGAVVGALLGAANPIPRPLLEGLRARAKSRLADYKAPDRVVVVDVLPLTSMMKVDKGVLARRAGTVTMGAAAP